MKIHSSSWIYNPVLGYVLLYPLLTLGYLVSGVTGKTPKWAYIAFRGLHCITGGAVNAWLSARISRRSRLIEYRNGATVRGAGPGLDAEAARAVEALSEKGYYVFDERLPDGMCEALLEFARVTPSYQVPAVQKEPVPVHLEIDSPRAPRYQFDEETLIKSPEIQRILSNPAFACIAQEYLGSIPINDMFTMWWSLPFDNEPSSAAAQLFHFDMDRIRFLKFFIYLTDVTTNTGAHVFIAGSHRTRPPAFRRDRRFTDDEVLAYYSPDKIHEIVGPPGTIFVADTSGLHKGKVLQCGSRLVFQLEFSNSLFGQQYDCVKLPKSCDSALRCAVERWPEVYARFQSFDQENDA